MNITDASARLDVLDNTYFNELRNEYVPDMGKAATVAGEIIRAFDRLVYRFFNDGDCVGEGYGNETCNSSYRFLYRTIGDDFPQLYAGNDDQYATALVQSGEVIRKYLMMNPDAFTTNNYTDSREPDDEDLAAAREEDYEDDFIDEGDDW